MSQCDSIQAEGGLSGVSRKFESCRVKIPVSQAVEWMHPEKFVSLPSRARERPSSLFYLLQTQITCIRVLGTFHPLETMHPTGTTLLRKMSPKDVFALEMISQLTAKITPEKIAAAVEGAMGAVLLTKEGPVPDYRTRMEAVKVALNYTVGMPVQRTEIKTQEIREEKEVLNALLASPAARDALRRRLDEAEQNIADRAGVVTERPATTAFLA